MFKKSVIAGLTAAALGSGLAQSQQPSAPASPHTFTGNVGIFSQYIFRGLTQTNGYPALQGGFDYGHESGFYVGTWGSNISWLRENFSSPGGVSGNTTAAAALSWTSTAASRARSASRTSAMTWVCSTTGIRAT